MTPFPTPVLVVGAGPVGLVAALTLLQNNIPVRIIEKEQEHRRGQRGPGIQPRTFEVFHFLGLSEIHNVATLSPPLREYATGSLEPLHTFHAFPYFEPTPTIPYRSVKLIGQPTLEVILRNHLAKYGCSVELGTELKSFTQENTCVRAKLVKKRDGVEVEEDCESAFLIGADGARGITRKHLGLTFLGETRNESNLVLADIRLEVKGLDREHWHFFGSSSGVYISLRPTDELGADGFQVLVVKRGSDPHHLLLDQAALLAYITKIIGLEVEFKEVLWLSEFRINIRMVDKFGVGKVFVAGDAAHVHSPTGGQGLNSGVQDVFNIAWKIAQVYKGLSPHSLLDTYTAERLPVIAEMLNLTTKLYHLLVDDPPATVAQEKSRSGSNAVKEGGQKPHPPRSTLERAMRRDQKFDMLGVNYRHSPIIVDEFASAPDPTTSISPAVQQSVPGQGPYRSLDESVLRAGDRAPDAPHLGLVGVAVSPEAVHSPHPPHSGSDTRLFDLFSPTHHTVLVFAPSTPTRHEIAAALVRWERGVVRPVIILPSEDSAHSRGSTPGEEHGGASGIDVLVDHAGHAYRAYVVERGETRVVVVRPDGVVGAVVRGVEGMQRYFEGIFVQRDGATRRAVDST